MLALILFVSCKGEGGGSDFFEKRKRKKGKKEKEKYVIRACLGFKDFDFALT
jgi:hypothetical protein